MDIVLRGRPSDNGGISGMLIVHLVEVVAMVESSVELSSVKAEGGRFTQSLWGAQ